MVVLYVFALYLLLLIPAALSPIFRQVFTDNILLGGASDWLLPLLILMFGIALLSASVTWMKDNCLMRLAHKIETMGLAKYVWLLLHSPLNLFHKKDRYQLLAQSNAAQRISRVLTRDILNLLSNIVSVVFYIIMMLRLDVLMTIIVVVLVALSFIMLKVKDFLVEKFSPTDENAPGSTELIFENERISSAGLENIETVKSTASETFLFQRWLGSKFAIINADRDSDYEKASEPLEDLPEIIFLNLLLFISAFRIMDREFTIGLYLAFQAFASAFFVPLSEVLNAGELFSSFEKNLQRLNGGLELEEKLTDSAHSGEGVDKLTGCINMENVHFGYDPETPVLHDIMLSVKPGQRVAILGNSGAGKTTMLKLLQGLYVPDSGEVTIGGFDPHHINARLYANSIGSANQEITIFAASVRDNITMWDDSISDADIYRAASDACIHEYIASLAGAYDYQLLEHGSNLSGGQKQRLEIARALLHNPSIIFMDEVTSAIDPKTRTRILENLKKRGCTCVIVTHVLMQMSDLDEIIILEKGTISHRGTHEYLLSKSEFYATLIREEYSHE
ncbi:MAG: ATP-binding cassette domain-containing protein [Defluviitaleaceae bacterium]|nr:ATP-binding cassette domain-containing protein [Defluviitaleaceae bacterium]